VKPEVRGWIASLGGTTGIGPRVVDALDGGGETLLEAYGEWLASEGIAAGLLSPTEAGRVEDRHVNDSLSFLMAWPAAPPATLHDAGSGGGLPGIPLAIALPETQVVLVERSSRRSELLKRAARVLGIENIEVQTRDLRELRECEAIVMRAVLPPQDAGLWMKKALRSQGVGVVALSRRSDADPRWSDFGTVVEATVLDPPGWLLIIRKRGH